MATKIQARRDTEANWTLNNPILLEGEFVVVFGESNKIKIGDGTTDWNSLDYFSGIASTSGGDAIPYNGRCYSWYDDDHLTLQSTAC